MLPGKRQTCFPKSIQTSKKNEQEMTQDPTLFTAFEWVLMAMAVLVTLVLFFLVHRAKRGSPFVERDESWLQDKSRSKPQLPTRK